MISRMLRLRLYGPRPLLEEATALLQEVGVVHIDPPRQLPGWGFRPFEEEGVQTRRLVDLEVLGERLGKALLLLPPAAPGDLPPDVDLERADPRGDAFADSVRGLLEEAEGRHRRARELREEQDLLEKYERVVRSLAPLLESVAASPHLEMVGITIDRAAAELLPLLRDALGAATGGDFQVVTADLDRQSLAAILVFGRSSAPRVQELLRERDLSEIRLPSAMAEMPLKDALGRIRERLESLPGEIEAAHREMAKFSRRRRATLAACRRRVRDLLGQFRAAGRFLCSKYTFQVGGWVPRRDAATLRERFAAAFAGRVVVDVDEAPARDAPVEIRNPSPIRPFEVFTRLLPLPVYGSLDPTPYFALFFPLFFGLILGDIGYGLVILAIALLARRRFPPGSTVRDLATAFAISACSAVFFGVLFGEFFATLGEHLGILRWIGRPVTDAAGGAAYQPLLYDRVHAMTAFLGLAVGVGAVHVMLGLVLGIYGALRGGRRGTALSRAGTLAALAALIFLLLARSLGAPSWASWIAAAILAAALVGVTALEGFVAPIEMMSAVGNVLSYARIMAIGMASVILGLVANRLGALPESIVLGVLVAGALHAVNVVLGVFSPTIHSMRLHFVEFFGKFYESGGRPYQPFGRSGGA